MDTVKLTLGEKDYYLEINFKAAYAFSTKVKDPAHIFSQFARHDETWLTLPNLVKSIQCALDSHGVKKSIDDIGEAIYKHNQKNEIISQITEYICLLAMGGRAPSKKKSEMAQELPKIPQSNGS